MDGTCTAKQCTMRGLMFKVKMEFGAGQLIYRRSAVEVGEVTFTSEPGRYW